MSVMYEAKSGCADDGNDEGLLPSPTEAKKNGKIFTKYEFNSDNKKENVVPRYKVEKSFVSTAAARENSEKSDDLPKNSPEPNPAKTISAEDSSMQFKSSKEEDNKVKGEGGPDKLKGMDKKVIVKCRKCNSNSHWTSQCNKETVLVGDEKSTTGLNSVNNATANHACEAEGGKNWRSPSELRRRREDRYKRTIRISNLPESTTRADLTELAKRFGLTEKVYRAEDWKTDLCKRFAYVRYKILSDARRAISELNGYSYNNHILTVDWSEPPWAQQN